MEFRPDEVPAFRALFAERKAGIKAHDGCLHVSLMQDVHEPSVFWTYSHWRDEAALANYRASGFFKDTWTRTKALFAEHAAAWSVQEVDAAL